MMQKMIVGIFLSLMMSQAFAWDLDGHRIIANIAEDQLNACTKSQISVLLKQAQTTLPNAQITTLVTAADWLDHDHSQCAQYAPVYCFPPPKSWHFVDNPYVLSGNPKTWPVKPPNVIWALNNAIQTLSSSTSTTADKAESLLIVDHLMGDMTQPLHNIDAYDQIRFKSGDRGGNLYAITYHPDCAMDYPVDNLHAFWDQGAGLFSCYNGQKAFIKGSARNLEALYADDTDFKARVNAALELNENPSDWSRQSYQYAKQVYATPYGSAPNQNYINQAQGIVKQQIMVAGLRLANTLNQAFINNGLCKAN